MTGPEHYLEAERLLKLAGDDFEPVDSAIRAEAQVHATLALVAAQAEAHPRSEWREAIA